MVEGDALRHERRPRSQATPSVTSDALLPRRRPPSRVTPSVTSDALLHERRPPSQATPSFTSTPSFGFGTPAGTSNQQLFLLLHILGVVHGFGLADVDLEDLLLLGFGCGGGGGGGKGYGSVGGGSGFNGSNKGRRSASNA